MTATVSSISSTQPKSAVPSLPRAVWAGRVVAALATVLALIYPLFSDDRYYQNMIIISLVFAIGASGLNIITGFTGYVSLGQSAFIGLGGYTIGVLATKFDSVSPWLWVPVAGVVAAAVAAGLGLVSLRSRGPAFVIITVAFLFLMQVVAVNWETVTGGTAGLLLPLPTWSIDAINWPYYYALIAILALQLLMTWWIRRSKFGMGLIAIREDETKAATIGINLPVHKVAAFVASSVFVGMAGAVYGYYLTFIDPLSTTCRSCSSCATRFTCWPAARRWPRAHPTKSAPTQPSSTPISVTISPRPDRMCADVDP
jgi:ABC-type branched-subunit amino acid transport system permease subunit